MNVKIVSGLSRRMPDDGRNTATLIRMLADESGGSVAEYALIMASLSFSIVIGVNAVRTTLANGVSYAATGLTNLSGR